MTSLTLWLWALVGGTCALYVGIAWRKRARSAADFYVADHQFGAITNGMATAAVWMSAASFISLAGLLALRGYDASVYLMGWTGGYVLLGLLVAPYLRRFGKYTVPEFIGDRYYSSFARLVAVLCLLIICVTFVIGQMRGVGVALSRFLEVDLTLGIVLGMGIVLIYSILGGMKGITYTQILQYAVLIFAYTTPAVFVALQLTHNPIPQFAPGAALADGVPLLDTLDRVLTDLGFGAYTERQDSRLNLFLITASLMIGTAGLPHVIVRFFSVRKVSEARTSAGWTLIFIAVLFTTAPAVGAMLRLNLTQGIQTGPVGAPEANLALDKIPDWANRWARTGLVAWEDKNGDGRLQYYDDTNPAFAERAASFGWQGNELTRLDEDMLVLANPELSQLPDWVIALVVAGGLAAALATAAALLLTVASAVSHDLIKGLILPGVSERTEVLVGRIAMVPAAALAAYLALDPPGAAAEVVALAFGVAAATLFPALMMGVFNKRMNATGAVLGMLTGLLFTLGYISWYKGFFFLAGTALAPDTPARWFLGISPQGIGAVGALLNFAVAVLVSRLGGPPPAPIRQLVEDIRVPRGPGSAPEGETPADRQ